MSAPRPRTRFYTRGFTTFLIALSFLMLLTSGIVVYATPRGRTAHWTGWVFAGLDKEQWGGVHTTSALLFILVAGLHLFFNWKVLLNYIRSRRAAGFRLKRELAAAVAVCLLIFAGTLYDVPPLSTVLSFHDQIKDYWERTSTSPPVGHAEELTLERYASQISVPLDEAVDALRTHGVRDTAPTMKVSEIAIEAGVTPEVIHRWILSEGRHTSTEGWAPRPGGYGLGRMTVGQYCATSGLEPNLLLAELRKRGISASTDHTMRSVASILNTTPHQVALFVEGNVVEND